MAKKTVLVSGGAGYIGSHVTVELINAGYDVVVADNMSNCDMTCFEGVKKITGRDDIPFELMDCCDTPLEPSIFKKIALFCNVKPECVIENITVPVLYEAPLMLEKHRFSEIVCRELNIDAPELDMSEWKEMIDRIINRDKTVHIGLVGKYVQLHDAYLSVAEALRHAGYTYGTHIKIHWIDSEGVNAENVAEKLSGCSGIIVPGGFGERGIEGHAEDMCLQ